MSTVASTEEVRAAFPALQRTHRGRHVAYLDGPGGTQVPQAVVDAMADYLLHHNANTHWNYATSEETDAMILDARSVLAQFLGGAPEEISFGNNMTTIAFHVARALARDWREGDEVIVTEIDHHANIAPWQAIARERGIVLRWLPLDLESMQLRLDLLPGLLNARTRLLAINGASNIVGTVSNVAKAGRIARQAGAAVFVDGVHATPHFLPDVAALGCDLFACSAYKFYGPHIGVLWAKQELIERMDSPRLEPAPDTAPERLETGTQNHEGIVGAAAAVKWMASLADQRAGLRPALTATYQAMHQRQSALFRQLWDGLGALPGVTRHGPGPETKRTATVSFTVRGAPSAEVASVASNAGCFISHGDFYAATVAKRLELETEGLVRIGAACYTTESEIERVLAVIGELAG